MMRQYYGEEKGRVYVKYEKKKAVTHIVAIRIIAAATTSAGSSQ